MQSSIGLCCALMLLAFSRAFTQDFYVATNGSDTFSGQLAAPDEKKTDGPFATLEHARDEIRKLRHDKKLDGVVTVHVRAGIYCLAQTFTLGAEDSNVVWRGFGDERPALVGGRQVTGFTPFKDKILVADLTAQGFKNPTFRQLSFDGKRQILARYPNFDPDNPCAGGWAYVDGLPWEMYRERPEDSPKVLNYKVEDARTWARPTDGEVWIFPRYNWWNNIVRIAAMDRDKRTLTLAADCSYGIRPGDRYFVQGMLEELDAPGEWYLDQTAGKLYFWPPSPLEGKSVVAPTLRTLVEIGKGTSHLTLQGFTLECCEGTAVVFRDSSDCRIAACTIRSVGDYLGSGVQTSGGLRNGVIGCDISEIGCHGIAIDGGDRKTLTPAENFADNNYIHHIGAYYKQGVGIALNGVGNRASHNLIHDGPRMGIMFSGNNLLIEYNEIRHLNLETEDTGAVYTGGRDWISSRGSVVRYNYFHDMLGFGKHDGKWVSPYFSWGVYLDDNTGGVDVIGNIVVRCSRAGIHLHNGRDNLIENNVFADNGLYQAEYSGWTAGSNMWKDHFPTMVKGYDLVSAEPAWQNMRNMKTPPKDAILPGGLIMSGNTLNRNIFYYHDPAAKVYRFSSVAFDHNEADHNLVWHNGLPISTGQLKAGKDVSGNLLANPSFEDGEARQLPTGWTWQALPSADCKAAATDEIAADGKRSLRIDGVKVPGATCNPPWPVIVGSDIPAKLGHMYRLSAKMKAARAETMVELAIQSYVANAYFWSRNTPAAVGTEWKNFEVVFEVPAKGEQGYHDQLKLMRPRIDLRGSEGTVWIDDVKLVEVETLDEWQSLQALGFDKNSVVADPLFVAPEQDDYRLKPESPAFKLGFQPIPVEKIGPYKDPLRASWPIAVARGAREYMQRKK